MRGCAALHISKGVHIERIRNVYCVIHFSLICNSAGSADGRGEWGMDKLQSALSFTYTRLKRNGIKIKIASKLCVRCRIQI